MHPINKTDNETKTVTQNTSAATTQPPSPEVKPKKIAKFCLR
jgi:hypothetical protein